jgi:hypothetical protein
MKGKNNIFQWIGSNYPIRYRRKFKRRRRRRASVE